MHSGAMAVIDLAALKHNFQQVKKYAPKSKIMAMVKSNGYGHGLLRIAHGLPQADAFGVACLKEAMLLHDAGIKQKIVLMHGFDGLRELNLILKNNFEIVVHSKDQVTEIKNNCQPNSLNIWLKIDTGMHRLGFSPEDLASVLSELKPFAKNIILMTHLSDADDINKKETIAQLNVFNKCCGDLTFARSVANSAAIVAWPESHAKWVRPGIMLYGVAPLADKKAEDFNVRPVMTLQSKIISVKKIAQGDRVGYGGTWQAPEDMSIGIVAIGYGDGYPRHAKNGTPVLLHNHKCSLIGRVSMDMIAIDLRGVNEAKCGDKVILWGNGLPVEEIAMWSDTIAYELLCGVTKRVDFCVA